MNQAERLLGVVMELAAQVLAGFVVVALVMMLGGCMSLSEQSLVSKAVAGDGPGTAAGLQQASLKDPQSVRNLPKSRSGNPPLYTVFGKNYKVLDSAASFRERGLASWYGAKFHGRLTSSGEPYDMYAMTAAHKHLPLPTFVRVTRTDTGQSIIVRVNDRGPFVDDRIIDLSYAAAAALDMLEAGTAPVLIEALSTHHATDAHVAEGPAAAPDTVGADPAPTPPGTLSAKAAAPTTDSAANSGSLLHYLQLGAFNNNANAASLAARANSHLPTPASIEQGPRDALYRVRFGPVTDNAALQAAVDGLAKAGIDGYTLVTVAH